MASVIRFQPDSTWQALTRFFDMAAPDANVYVEIPAPDLRFAAIVLLALGALAVWRKLGPGRRPTFALLGMLLVSAALWMYTSGNGRYFMPLLVVAGPLAVALVCLLPIPRRYQALLALLLVTGQGLLLTQQTPWNAWSVVHWSRPPYFAVKLGPREKDAPATTYASLSVLSYSLLAPQFPPQSRWINLASGSGTPRDEQWIHDFLRRAAAEGPVRMIAPSVPAGSRPDGLPTPGMQQALDKVLGRRGLHISGACGHIVSPGLIRMAEEAGRASGEDDTNLGFWTCPLVYESPKPGSAPQDRAPPAEVLAAFAKLGELCPRFFPGSEPSLERLGDGWQRRYSFSETRVYVLDNGDVLYQFWRSLNPVLVGRIPDLLAGKVGVDCSAIRNDGAWRTGAQ